MIRNFLLAVTLVSLLSTSALGETPSPHRFSIVGPLRMGGFELSRDVRKTLDIGLSYEGNRLENTIGKNIHLEYVYQIFGIGMRWMSYTMKGNNASLEHTLELEYQLLTTSIVLYEGNFLHPDVMSRIGVMAGSGENRNQLTSKDNSGQTENNPSISSSGNAVLYEIFFDSALQNGWGYRLGYMRLNTYHDSEQRVSGSTAENTYLAIRWEY